MKTGIASCVAALAAQLVVGTTVLYASPDHTRHEASHGEHDGHDQYEDQHEGQHGGQDEVHLEAGHGDQYNHQGGNRTRIDPRMAERAGITLAVAGPAKLLRTETAYGRLVTSPDHISHIHARFAGEIQVVKVNLGDSVSAGDTLALIESNDSLQRYTLKAPIAGRIIQRHANAGETTGDEPLFTIASIDVLWAELKIFPRQQSVVRIGLPVVITANDLRSASSISHQVPALQGETPFVTAWALIDNGAHQWQPGMQVKGQVEIGRDQVELAVDNRALQTMAGVEVAFVRDGDNYEARPLRLGRSDGSFSEVIAGINAGERYVVENSFLIKADIEKSGAGHHH